MPEQQRTTLPLGPAPALVGTVLVLGAIAYAYWIEDAYPDFFYQSVQEDEYLEWGTFWAFMLAAFANGWGAVAQRRATGALPWFLAGLGLFCFVVAMEEISWAQRVFGYRPPAYFLENNFQQELNVHNVIDTGVRKDAFVGLIAAYGVALPIAAALPVIGGWVARLGMIGPSLLLVPAFAASIWVYQDYPWNFAGEIVELAVGLGFLAAALTRARELASAPRLPGALGQSGWVAAAGLLAIVLGIGNAAISRAQRSAAPEAIASAEMELAALKRDFYARAATRGGRMPVTCGIHKRLYTYVEQYRQRFLKRGEFAGLVEQGLPEERADFFIDPWNNPYWIRSRCTKDRNRRSVFVYSFGPNRLRDSTKWDRKDDDVGTYLLRMGFEGEEDIGAPAPPEGVVPDVDSGDRDVDDLDTEDLEFLEGDD